MPCRQSTGQPYTCWGAEMAGGGGDGAYRMAMVPPAGVLTYGMVNGHLMQWWENSRRPHGRAAGGATAGGATASRDQACRIDPFSLPLSSTGWSGPQCGPAAASDGTCAGQVAEVPGGAAR